MPTYDLVVWKNGKSICLGKHSTSLFPMNVVFKHKIITIIITIYWNLVIGRQRVFIKVDKGYNELYDERIYNILMLFFIFLLLF